MQQTSEAEADLVLRASAGDRAAFADLYDAYFGRIYDYCFQLVRNQADAADVCSETFLKAMERLDRLREPGAFRGWLYAIARNACLSLIDRRKRTTDLPDDTETIPGTAVDPSIGLDDDDLRALVWEAAATLNPRDYSIFEMTVRQGLDSSEVAAALGVKASHAYVLVSRLKDSVEDALGAVVLARAGRRDCADLDAIVGRFGDERSPKMRKTVVRHLKACDECKRSRAKYASVAALLSGVAHAEPAAGLKREIARSINALWDVRGPRTPRRGDDGGRRAQLLGSVIGVCAVLILLAFAQRADPSVLGVTAGPTASPAHASPSPVKSATPAATPTVAPVSPSSSPQASRASTPRPSARATPGGAAGPSVDGMSVSPSILFTGPCGPRTANVSTRVSAPAGVQSVQLVTDSGGAHVARTMSGSGGSYSGVAGPFQAPGAATARVVVTDVAGRTSSATRQLLVSNCRAATPTPPPRFPTAPPRATPTPCFDPRLCPGQGPG